MKTLKVAVIGLALLCGCDRTQKGPDYQKMEVAEALRVSQDKSLRVDDHLLGCENYFRLTHRGADIVPQLRLVIADKEAWAYTPRLAALLSKMGPDAAPLKADLLKKQDESPNSQSRRWQDCIDAIRD